MSILKKIAGVLDPVQPRLAKDVWGDNFQLLPHVRQQILDKLFTTLPKHIIKEVFIIGSITGFKYSETSDIDVNVRLSDLSAFYHEKKDILNGELAEGTRRPINYFIVEHDFDNPSTSETWADYKYGVYDVLHGK